jgi:hypothetical protein
MTAASAAAVTLRGISWPGFDSGGTFVALAGADQQPAWVGGDFAATVHVVRLLGFNAVRLPFTFDDLQSAPLDVTRACPGQPPSIAELTKLAVSPKGPPKNSTALPPPPQPFWPPGYGSKGGDSSGSGCNAYVPRGPTTLTRLLWTAEFLTRAGLYVVLDFRPQAPTTEALTLQGLASKQLQQQQQQQHHQQQHQQQPPNDLQRSAPDANGPEDLGSPAAFAAAWQRLAAALTCLPAWKEQMSGRVLLDLISSPTLFDMSWKGGSASRPPLGDYYLAAMDAVGVVSPGGFLFMLQGGAGGALGASFAADAHAAVKLGADDAAGFWAALVGRSYRARVLITPSIMAAAVADRITMLGGPKQWETYAQSWWVYDTRSFG